MDMKICTKCKVEKPVEDFSINKRVKTGLKSRCKACSAEDYAHWISTNKENKKKSKKEWYDNNKPHVLEYARVYAKNNKERCAEAKKNWYIRNSVQLKQKAKQYHIDNVEHKREKAKEWKLLNRHRATAAQRKRELAKTKATPSWLTDVDKMEIENFYWLAKDLERVSGQKYHVDHIIPLKGKDVCGLHVPWNLQILPADINIEKSNNYK